VPGTSNQAAAGLIVKASYGVPFLMRTLIQARTELQSIAVGAAQQNINQRVLKSRRIIVPPSELAATYSRVISPFDAQKVTIARESHSLAALRDTLLPKLISGELRVADFEAFSSRVV
jgi:type I restriction enzyme S subunit